MMQVYLTENRITVTYLQSLSEKKSSTPHCGNSEFSQILIFYAAQNKYRTELYAALRASQTYTCISCPFENVLKC